MTALEKENLKLFKNYITRILRPTYVVGYMTPWFSEENVEQIKSEEQKGPTSAADMFLECLLTLKDPKWFRGLLDGLREAGYTGLQAAIENWDFSQIEKLEVHRTLLSRIEPSITRNIKPEEVAIYLASSSCLLPREREEVLQITEQKGNIAGAAKLIECLLRSDKENWPKEFLFALENGNYESSLTDLWRPLPENGKITDGTKAEDEENESDSAMDIQYHYTEEADDQNLDGQPCPDADDGTPEEAMNHQSDEVMGDVVVQPHALNLRKYQRELAQPVFRGKNTIICAPTGCGKTIVALAITEDHLKAAQPEEKRMVVFMATKVPVYEQQYGLFKKHFEPLGYQVVGLCGETADEVPIGKLIVQKDIIVLTPQILVNCLTDGSIPSVSIFTLLIFDECHNTTGNHPYNVLMRHYLDIKLSASAQPLPQIVGLTASVGVGGAKNVRAAMDYICQLCACLDVKTLSTVQENLKEMEKFIYKPEKFIHEVGRRERDPFMAIISQMMTEVEAMARSIFSIDTLSNMKSRDHGTQKYEQWIVDVQKKCRVLQMEDKDEESRICRSLFTLTEHLRKYNDALIINEDARTKDAVAYLEKFFDNVKSGGFDDLEQQLTKTFEGKIQQLKAIAEDEANENPKLEQLTFILNEEYRQNQQTRTLLFVRTRALADALKNWIEESPTLHFLKPDVLIGRGKREQKLGMTLPSQKNVLQSFKEKDEISILIATSVADEGIDIAQCNLVLLYEYVGNVIKMIQVRGRGRAHGSKCYLVTSKKEQVEKEKINLLHEEIMNDAIQLLQKMDRDEFLKKVNDLQEEEKKFRDFKKLTETKPKLQGNRILLCGRCKEFACSTEEIRTIQKSHHVVIDEAFPERYLTKPHGKPVSYDGFCKKSKMLCKNCMHDWGIIASYQTLHSLPVIKIESFVVENTNTKEQLCFRKWRNVDFVVKEFSILEMSIKKQNTEGTNNLA